MQTGFSIDGMQASDWPQVSEIYRQGIASGLATFETDVPSWQTWDERHLPCCRLTARTRELLLGWAALAPVSYRPVYAGVAEVSIYIHADWRGRGVGRALLQTLVAESESNGIWTLQAGLLANNDASLNLHQGCGFRLVGKRQKIAKMNDIWHDTLLLERRSTIVAWE